MCDTKYLVIFYGVSAGQNGDNLGSDEQDLVMLIFLVINTEEKKVRLPRRPFRVAKPTLPLGFNEWLNDRSVHFCWLPSFAGQQVFYLADT